jgi:hypothetical protein
MLCFSCWLLATACQAETMAPAAAVNAPAPSRTPPQPTPTPTSTVTATLVTPSPPPPATMIPPCTPSPAPTATPAPAYANLDDFWAGHAYWQLEVADTGLPLGESDTIHRGGGEYWSFLHASYESAGVVDQCGDPVPFPGCVTLWKSHDNGRSFALEDPVCLFSCAECPCTNEGDHIAQQQYPRVSFQPDQAYLVYEHGAYVYLRTSADGLHWSEPLHVPGTWIWTTPYGFCGGDDVIGVHPHIYHELDYDCLVGGPPGIYVQDDQLTIFVSQGQSPGHMACFTGPLSAGAAGLRRCAHNPLFGAENGYGPPEALGPAADPYFEFRTISSADVIRVGERYYMTYEGIRGPSSHTVVDDQFGLGLARSLGPALDGPWEKYPGSPIISSLPGSVGIGHADILVVGEATYLFTATSDTTRGRYVLARR